MNGDEAVNVGMRCKSNIGITEKVNQKWFRFQEGTDDGRLVKEIYMVEEGVDSGVG